MIVNVILWKAKWKVFAGTISLVAAIYVESCGSAGGRVEADLPAAALTYSPAMGVQTKCTYEKRRGVSCGQQLAAASGSGGIIAGLDLPLDKQASPPTAFLRTSFAVSQNIPVVGQGPVQAGISVSAAYTPVDYRVPLARPAGTLRPLSTASLKPTSKGLVVTTPTAWKPSTRQDAWVPTSSRLGVAGTTKW